MGHIGTDNATHFLRKMDWTYFLSGLPHTLQEWIESNEVKENTIFRYSGDALYVWSIMAYEPTYGKIMLVAHQSVRGKIIDVREIHLLTVV